MHGSGNLIQTLLRHNLVDEYRLWVFPVVIGLGQAPVRPTGPIPGGLKLVDSKISTTGVVIGTYEPAGEIVTGSFGGRLRRAGGPRRPPACRPGPVLSRIDSERETRAVIAGPVEARGCALGGCGGEVRARGPYRRRVGRVTGFERSTSSGVARSPPRVRGAGQPARGGPRRARAGRWWCAARPGSARRRCCEYAVDAASELHGWCGPPASSPRWSWRSPALHQLCAPMLDRLERLPGPQRDALADGVRAERRARAGPLPGRPGRAEPAVRGGRGAAAGVRGRRRAVAGPGLGAGARRSSRAGCWPSRSRWSSRRARAGARSSRACRSWSSRVCATPTRARCWTRCCRGPLDDAGARPDRRRDARQPAGAAGAAARA